MRGSTPTTPEAVEARVAELEADCGCGAGAVAVWLAAAAYGTWLLASGTAVGWSVAGRGLLLLVGAAIVGKVAGLARNRILIWRLLSSTEPAPRTGGHV